jgi:rRNA maturation protein Nop10
MSEPTEKAPYLEFAGEKVPLEHVEIRHNDELKGAYELKMRECDGCGGKIHPHHMTMRFSTDPEECGVYHQACLPAGGHHD